MPKIRQQPTTRCFCSTTQTHLVGLFLHWYETRPCRKPTKQTKVPKMETAAMAAIIFICVLVGIILLICCVKTVGISFLDCFGCCLGDCDLFFCFRCFCPRDRRRPPYDDDQRSYYRPAAPNLPVIILQLPPPSAPAAPVRRAGGGANSRDGRPRDDDSRDDEEAESLVVTRTGDDPFPSVL